MKIIKHKPKYIGGKMIPNMLVIHAMADKIQGLESYEFLDQLNTPLSAHFYLKTNGDFIKSLNTDIKGRHAKGYNSRSIGIEVLVDGDLNYQEFKNKIKTDWVTKKQYRSLVKMTKSIIEYWDIPLENVVRHSDLSPQRKNDPGEGFKWDWFKDQLI